MERLKDFKHDPNELIKDNIYLTEMTNELAHEFFNGYVNDKSLFFDESQYQEYVYDYDKVESFVDNIKKANKKSYAIINLGKAVGEVRFKNITEDSLEIGISLKNDEYKNKGIGTKAIRRALLYARVYCNSKAVTASILKNNTRSQHVFEGIGFTKYDEDDMFFYYRISTK